MTNAAINELIRRAARPEPLERREPPAPLIVGDLGVGRGGCAGPPARRPDTSAEISAAIRLAAHRATRRIGVDGVSLDDVLGGR
jgi:hypothetical protein